MFKFLKRNVFYEAYKDIQNFIKFKKQIKAEKENPLSKFNAYKLRTNWFGNCIYTQKTLSDTQMLGDEKQRYLYLLDMTRPENEYFSNDLFWSEYLTFDTYNFADAESGMPSNTYGIIWKFVPYAFNTSRFYSALTVIGFLILGGLITLIKLGLI